jgi:hypothetical protein
MCEGEFGTGARIAKTPEVVDAGVTAPAGDYISTTTEVFWLGSTETTSGVYVRELTNYDSIGGVTYIQILAARSVLPFGGFSWVACSAPIQ